MEIHALSQRNKKLSETRQCKILDKFFFLFLVSFRTILMTGVGDTQWSLEKTLETVPHDFVNTDEMTFRLILITQQM